MAFRFDRMRALKPVAVTWKLQAHTVASLEEWAQGEGVTVEALVQQALDHMLEERRRKRTERAGGGRATGRVGE